MTPIPCPPLVPAGLGEFAENAIVCENPPPRAPRAKGVVSQAFPVWLKLLLVNEIPAMLGFVESKLGTSSNVALPRVAQASDAPT